YAALPRTYLSTAARDARPGAHTESALLVHPARPRQDVDRLVVDAEVRQQRLHLHTARAAGPPIDAQFAHVATFTPRTPCLSIARATNPDCFTSSANSRRYFAATARPFGAPIACCTPVICPSSTREPGVRSASSTSFGLSP